MTGVEACNIDVYHRARVVQAELEPIVVSEVCAEALNSPSVIVLVETLALGMKALTYSANVAAEAEGMEIGKGAMGRSAVAASLSAVMWPGLGVSRPT